MSDEAARIDICGVTFNQGPDVDGIVRSCRIRSGWHGSPTDVKVIDPTGSNGGVETERRAPARSLVVSGSVWAPTQALAWQEHEVVAKRMPGLFGSGAFDFYEPVPKRLRVRQGAAPDLESPAAGRFEFLLTLLGLDPFKTALSMLSLLGLAPFKTALSASPVTVAAGASVDLTNLGDQAAYVSAETTGSGTVWLRNDVTSAVMRSKDSVASGTVFDALNKTVTPAVPMLAPSQWLAVPAESTVPFTNLGTAPLDLTVFDTYS